MYSKFRHCRAVIKDMIVTSSVNVTITWVIESALLGCTLVPNLKSVGEIASKIWPIVFLHISWNATLIKFDFDF